MIYNETDSIKFKNSVKHFFLIIPKIAYFCPYFAKLNKRFIFWVHALQFLQEHRLGIEFFFNWNTYQINPPIFHLSFVSKIGKLRRLNFL
jgi:hypothetical protein